MQNVMMRLNAVEREAVQLWLLAHHNFSFGTICSGTDGPALIFKAFAEAASETFHIKASAKHYFSCEANADKRRFIADMCEPQHIFGDVAFLADEAATAFDYRSGTVMSIPRVNNVTFGFPCQDGSTQNPNRCTQLSVAEHLAWMIVNCGCVR